MASFILGSAAGPPVHSDSDRSLRIAVVFTDFEETKAALRTAAELSAGLQAAMDIIVAQVVPYPLSLAEPPVPASFTLDRIDDLAHAANVEPGILVYLCRDVIQTLVPILETYSIIVMGSKKRWLRSKPEHLAKVLQRQGLHVIVTRHH